MSVKSRRRAARSQAKTASELQFLPQAQALSQLLRATNDQYAADTAQTRSYAASVRANALSQVAPLRAALQPILDQQRGDQATSASRLAAIGPGGSDYAASAAREAQAANARLSGTQAGAVTELNSRASDALAGGQYALTNMASKHSLDQQKIMDQIAGLSQQKGLYTAKAYQDALQALRSQDITLKGIQGANERAAASLGERTRHDKALEDAANRRAAAAAKKQADKKKHGTPLTPGQSNTIVSQIGQAKNYIDMLAKQGLDSHTIRTTLIQGHKTPKGNTIPAFKDPRIVNIAYDLHSFNALSRPNRAALLKQLRVRRSSVPRSWLSPVTNVFGAIGGFANQLSQATRG